MRGVLKILSLLLIAYQATAVSDEYYPRYHLAPPYGWMNDPNGFSIFNGEYHLFYQFNPNSSLEPGVAHWGHAKSTDLFDWVHLPIAMYPDQEYDATGVFSGSALVENNTMYLYYTGNVNHPDQTPDHTQRQALAISHDGVKVEKYEGNPIIIADEHQPNIRDPKVWKHGDTYYMVLGNSFENNTLGRVLLYTSPDRISWTQASVLAESNGTLGYMFECPDFFELDGHFVLLFSPQGVEPQGDKYKNLYQTGYIIGSFNYETNVFTPVTEFQELDHGHDFYATQTIVDAWGRRIVVAWFDMWETNYPEAADGFTGQMTIARRLRVSNNLELLQTPVKEVIRARGKSLYAGSARDGKSVDLENKAGYIRVRAPVADLELLIESSNASATVKLSYDSNAHIVSLDRGGSDGIRRTPWTPKPFMKIEWRIFVDASSIELFCGDGEVTFSSRFFPQGDVRVSLGQASRADTFLVYQMQRTVPAPDETENNGRWSISFHSG